MASQGGLLSRKAAASLDLPLARPPPDGFHRGRGKVARKGRKHWATSHEKACVLGVCGFISLFTLFLIVWALPILSPQTLAPLTPLWLTPWQVRVQYLLAKGEYYRRLAGPMDPPGGVRVEPLEQAIAVYGELLTLAPRSADALYHSARCYHRLGLHAKALAMLDTALAHRYEHRCMFSKAQLLLDLGREDRVYEAFDLMARSFAATKHARDLLLGSPRAHGNMNLPLTTRSRLRHDLQQMQHLAHKGLLSEAEAERAEQALVDTLEQLSAADDPVARATARRRPRRQGERRQMRIGGLAPGVRGGEGEEGEGDDGESESEDEAALGRRVGATAAERARRDMVVLTASQLDALRPYVNRALVFEPPALLEGGLLNPELDRAAVERQWQAARRAPGQAPVLYMDNVLRPEALAQLQQFCADSTIFNAVKKRGYLCSFMDYGFAAPLVAQLTAELHAAFPAIFCGHTPSMVWAYKYDDSNSDGIGIHADMAAVNVNCWLADNDHNLEPTRGGLVVWPSYPPRNWTFEQYNLIGEEDRRQDKEVAEYRRMLMRTWNTTAITIPHRQNRCVIFDSSLFHTTDLVRFKRGYTSRRINLTLLFGRMHETCEDVEHRKEVWSDVAKRHGVVDGANDDVP